MCSVCVVMLRSERSSQQTGGCGEERGADGHVLLLALEEPRDTLDAHVVRLGRTGSEDDVLGVRTDEVRDVLPTGAGA